jgi:hypothetical protein
VDYKHLNRIFEIEKIKYDERPPPAYAHVAKPSIENATRKRRGGPLLSKNLAKKKKIAPISVSSEDEDAVEEGVEMETGREVSSQEIGSLEGRDAKERMISLAFNSSGKTPLMLTPLGAYF